MGKGYQRTKVVYRDRPKKKARRSPLHDHPNLAFPPRPEWPLSTPAEWRAIVEWTCACAAELVSPRQEDGEDDEMECTEVAQALRDLPSALLQGSSSDVDAGAVVDLEQ